MTEQTNVTMDRRTALKTTLGAGTLAFAGCLADSNEDVFRVGSPWEVDRDPLDGGSALRRVGITEALVTVDYDATPGPGLAVDWERVADTRWEFSLREGVTFHDGETLTAETAVASLERTVESPAFASVPITAVEAVDESTVTLETDSPFAPLPAHLSRHEAVILGSGSFADGQLTKPVGTGPFAVESIQPGTELLAIRNNEYYGEVATIESVRYEVVEDDQIRRMKLENDELEMARILPQETVDDLESTDGVDVYTPEIPRIRFLTFDTTTEPFDDRQVRQAMNHAVDRRELTESVLEGVDEPAVGPISPALSDWANPDLEEPLYDPDRARDLLDDAGWTGDGGGDERTRGGEPLSVEVVTYDARSLPLIAEVIQGQLADVGIDLSIELVEYGTMLDRVSRESFDAYLTSWSTLWYPDPDRLADMFHSDSDLHHGYENEDVDDLLENARELEDREERRDRYYEVQSTVREDAPIAVLTNYTNVIAVSSAVGGYDPHPTETTYGLERVDRESG
ncbi:ABC transporter substrate-binding protein [Natronobacterium gregoryi]|uniref:ABC-type dipeptide transport system, periplasmic component n=2 Tax=Natronobacterium gregoryi TaxID=44930 RepID=L0ALV1_NATGS|nr:ABC transporter substrate-binding protein [Natronobacterium gregoryi]AFZ74439.1 ABC-type dipeptide transport system, periplasmic component [Natronobacterium gregoryi SP2]ELY72100.1 peptide ABC transporter periplasmic protein [Natronobacterium gregoryi SP2]PLK19769.1 peptide ABC transporter substrate-binding protein [Natronobacterium gregoryi SP2]SFJ40993.1 peptide/nickel transport system substrate-binding protein [Natronobacterium gregoryi]